MLGKQRAVELKTVGNTHREKKKVTRRHKPGKNPEKPQPQFVGEKEQYFIRYFFHFIYAAAC